MAIAGDSGSALRQRWKSPSGAQLAADVWSRLKVRQDLDDLGLIKVDGRWDLKGIALPANSRELKNVSFESLDLRHASLASVRLFDSRIVNCALDRANCVDWRLWGVDIEECSFVNADLIDSALGGWWEGRGNNFSHVRFNSANMRDVATSAAIYVDCDFSFADLRGINFWQSSLIRCTFAGLVKAVIFDGRLHKNEDKPDPNPMMDVDFSGAKFEGCDFRGVSFAHVKLPNDPDLILLADAEAVVRAVSMLEVRNEEPDAVFAAQVLSLALRSIGPNTQGLVNLRDVEDAARWIRESLPEF